MVGERLGRFAASIKDGFEDVVELVDDKIEKPIILDIKGMKQAGGECAKEARKTSRLCTTTVSKAQQMVEFGKSLQQTLEEVSDGDNKISAETFATIKDLIDGDQMKASWKLATELDDLALKCVEHSVRMIDSMEKGIDTLPDILEDRLDNKMEQAQREGSRDGDPELRDVSPDIEQLEKAVKEVEEVNLFTVMSSGQQAFRGLTSKGQVCFELFDTIKDFSVSVAEVAGAIENFKLGNMIGKIRDLVKDIWRCLRLSDLIKAFAQSVGKLIKWIISLFQKVSDKLSKIWGALAKAKDTMVDIIEYVLASLKLCDDAKDHSRSLVSSCDDVTSHMGNIATLNKDSIGSIKELADGDEIKAMIRLATTLDDVIMDCIKKVIEMIQKVTKGFRELPGVLLEGMPEDAEVEDDDPEPADVEDDVEEMNKARALIEEAGPMDTVKSSQEGFCNVKEKFGKCQDMITSSRSFAESCKGNIDSFTGTWDLKNAMSHLIEMKRLVRLGEMMKQFAEEIHRLVQATIEVMNAALNKIKNIDLVPDVLEDAVGSLQIDGHRLKKVGIDGSRIKKLGNMFK
jgi:chemotaxis regulatin CheY-phosphate phosphatase CheZ